MFNESDFKGKWNEVKGEILSFWGKVTEDELEKTKGNLVSIVGLIQQRYGEEKDIIQEKLSQLYQKTASDVGSKLTNVTENIKNRINQKPAHTDVSPTPKDI